MKLEVVFVDGMLHVFKGSTLIVSYSWPSYKDTLPHNFEDDLVKLLRGLEL